MPEHEHVWSRLNGWFKNHPKVVFVDLERLARELADISEEDLAEALRLAVASGVLRQVYRLKNPSGVFIGESYSTPTRVPERIPDAFHTHYYDVNDLDIVAGFTAGAAGEQP